MNDEIPALTSPPNRTMLNIVGVVVLVLGLGVAAVLYAYGQKSISLSTGGNWQDNTLSTDDSKANTRDVEMYNGKLGMWALDLEDWCSNPQSWVVPVALASLLGAIACFRVANRSR